MADSKKERILQALLDLIKEKNQLSAITVSLIAQRAGIGKGTIYEYFSSKEEIFIETVGYYIRQNMQFMQKIRSDFSFRESFAFMYQNIRKSMSEYKLLVENALPGNRLQTLQSDLMNKLKQEQQQMLGSLLQALRRLNQKAVEEQIVTSTCSDEDLMFAFFSIFAFLEFAQCVLPFPLPDPENYCYDKFIKLLRK